MKYKLKNNAPAFPFQGIVINGGRRFTEDSPVVRAFPGRFEAIDEAPVDVEPEPYVDPPEDTTNLGDALYEGNDFQS